MNTISLNIPETQLVDLVRKLTPSAKRSVLRALIPDMNELDQLVQYGNHRIRAISARRGVDWDSLNEQERQELIDQILHET